MGSSASNTGSRTVSRLAHGSSARSGDNDRISSWWRRMSVMSDCARVKADDVATAECVRENVWMARPRIAWHRKSSAFKKSSCLPRREA